MKYYSSLVFLGALTLFAAQPALAHEHHTLMIGNAMYSVIVGSLNEPITVDDKTGVDLRVRKLGTMAPGSHDHTAISGDSAPVTGLEGTLKVELIAGDAKKTLELSPAWNDPGAYRAQFYPTTETTLTYRFFGTIDTVPVDLSFTCNPSGHLVSPEDKTEVMLSTHVMRTEKRGAFGCPAAKAAFGFPEESVSLGDVTGNAKKLEAAIGGFRTPGAILALVALAVSILGFIRSERRGRTRQ